MSETRSVQNCLPEICSGQSSVVQLLTDEGRLPNGWVEEYSSLLAEIPSKNNPTSFWPWAEFSSIHFVSTHLYLRYNLWRIVTGLSNPETEKLLGRVQFESELFLWDSVSEIPSFLNLSDIPESNIIDQNDANFVKLCFNENFFVNSQCDKTKVSADEWKDSYISNIETFSKKWGLQSNLWKWLGLAIRFVSFHTNLAPLSKEMLLQCKDQHGCDPKRIRDTVNRICHHFSNHEIVELIDLWLRLSHLRRNSLGLPDIFSEKIIAGRYNRLRSVSEVSLNFRG